MLLHAVLRVLVPIDHARAARHGGFHNLGHALLYRDVSPHESERGGTPLDWTVGVC